MAEGTTEKDFEAHIEDYLYEKENYWVLNPEEYDRDLCLHPESLIAFIQESQPKAYQELAVQYGATVNEKIVQNVAKNIQQRKTIDVLRNGIKDRGQKIHLVFFKPANNKTPEHEEWYAMNRLGVIRQLRYSKKNTNEIDMAFFINGIPVATVELKNALTGQNHHNAIKQYLQDRDPSGEPLLEFKRCLVHLAVGTEKVFMTTELKGKDTFFLPFNKGLYNEDSSDFAVSYLWKDVLTKESLLDLVQNFISIQEDSKIVYDQQTKQLKEIKSSKLLFPRFHQRRAVNRILEQLKEDGTGKNYLIQHSAGSGKSNTIVWLAYRLANYYKNYTDTKALFNSIFVVTDRRVLNKQIQDNIRQLDDTPGVVAYIDEKSTSQDLKKAIEDGKRIIVTTLQKFPIISDAVTKFPSRNYAIIIDEAHSSQSGDAAKDMRKSMSLETAASLESEEEKTLDEIIADEIKRKGQQQNISQFAFTATPKQKTIELFGTLKNGVQSAFDEYTMEQAIKEGFILDVLQNYMSFQRYYKLVKRTEIKDKEYEKKKTVRVLSNYVDLQDHAIETKSRIMIEHFVSQTQQEIQGQARAMLVTKSRLHAVRYKRKFDEIMSEMKLPYRALVAFSGTVFDEETNEEYTENSMNNLEGKLSIPESLKLPNYRFLIVANKYQTGFDEPLMQTMFVDKKLGGANTVQTLSRLNRTTKGKSTTMVLDFVNDPDLIREDFQFYYGVNFMEEENKTDPNSLYEILSKVESFKVYYPNDIETFAKIFFKPNNNFEQLQPILNEIARRFETALNPEQQLEFKSSAKSFTKIYRFLSQIITFTDIDLEKAYVFLTAVLKKLPYLGQGLPLDVINDIELDSYKVQHQFTTSLKLESGDASVSGLSPDGTIGGNDEDYDLLTKIIQKLNDTFGLELTEEDKVEFQKMKEKVNSNMELMSFFNPNNSKDNIQEKFNETIDEELINFINVKLDLYNKLTDNKANEMLKMMWFNELYNQRMRVSR
ncbi:MAG: type I restriction endonuclease subunit R [Flavobacteriales bacterium]|nr:type I restriction endonuclease subunit R [Crocinitomicaceae bacterium]NBX79401.1 type I restriction endonuclease subunit R [Flavobacteriales bacterium]